jgi:hypothetical protein
MSTDRNKTSYRLYAFLIFIFTVALSGRALGQACFTVDELDPGVKSALETTANNYFGMITRGDTAALRQNAIPSLASSFNGIEELINDNKTNLAGATATARPPYLLKLEGTAPLARAEFLCGVFGANGQTANSAEFVLNNLAPGSYGFVSLDVKTAKTPYFVSFVLQQDGTNWKLGGLFIKAAQINGHDGSWFLDKARAYKAQNKSHDAWFYYIEAHSLLTPVEFMTTQSTDKLYDEAETVKPSDLPPSDLAAANGKTYKLIAMYPLVVGDNLDLIVKFQSADVSNSSQAFQDNMAVMKALVVKYPELRDAFDGVVARATETSGRDYGTVLSMKEIK